MEIPWKPLLFWTPRVLCLLFAVFLSLFALDVFNEGYGFWKTILALLVHLIPTWIVLAVLAISWRWEWAGALLFACLGTWYLLSTWGRMHWSAHLVISGPLSWWGPCSSSTGCIEPGWRRNEPQDVHGMSYWVSC
jgi:hypothetical protein